MFHAKIELTEFEIKSTEIVSLQKSKIDKVLV